MSLIRERFRRGSAVGIAVSSAFSGANAPAPGPEVGTAVSSTVSGVSELGSVEVALDSLRSRLT